MGMQISFGVCSKYRRQIMYGKIKQDIGRMLRELCYRKDVEIIQAECCKDHIHILVRNHPSIVCQK